MVPVQQGVVQPHLQPLGPESVQVLPHQVPAAFGVGGLEVRQGAVEKAEAIVMLGGEHGVLHAGLLGRLRPLPGVVVHGVKLLEILQVLLLGHFLGAPDPFAPGGEGVDAPVEEHTEAGLLIPLHSFFVLFAVELIHGFCSFIR